MSIWSPSISTDWETSFGSACVSGITPNGSVAGARFAAFDLAGALVARDVCAFVAVVFARLLLGFAAAMSSSSKASTSSVSLPPWIFVLSFNACLLCAFGAALRFVAVVLARRAGIAVVLFDFEVVVLFRLCFALAVARSSSLSDAPA